MGGLYRLHSRLSNVCPMMVQPEQSPEGSTDPAAPLRRRGRRCGSASSPGEPGCARRRFAPGSAGTTSSSLRGARAGFASTPPPTRSGFTRCAPCSPRESPRPRPRNRRDRRRGAAPAPVRSPDAEADRLRAALEAYDEEAANAVLDRALGAFSLDVFTGSVVLPAMAEIGSRWAAGEVVGRPGALRRLGREGAPARDFARLGIRSGPARAAGVPARRAARHRAHRVRALAARQGLADRLSGAGHAARHARRDRPSAGACRRRDERRDRRASRVSRFRARRGGGPRPRVGRRRRGQRGVALRAGAHLLEERPTAAAARLAAGSSSS